MKKKTTLFAKKDTRDVLDKDANIFEQERFAREHSTLSENGSDKYTTTGSIFLDDFAMLSKYKEPRDVDNIFETMEKLWSHDPLRTLQLTVFLRLITRKTVLFNGDKLSTQRGQGLKHEFLGRLLWLAHMHPDTFKKNLQYFVVAGSWKDVFDLMRYDLSYNGKEHPMLDWDYMIAFIIQGLQEESQTNLVKKYLPQIYSAKACNTLQKQCNAVIGRRIARVLFGNPSTNEDKIRIYTDYRKLKTSGNAHDWQKKISQGDYLHINWDTIAGRALQKLVNSKFLGNHNLEEIFSNWMLGQETAKFTGYPYELFKDGGYGISRYSNINLVEKLIESLYPKRYQRELVNKQFLQLIEVAKQDMNRHTGFIVAMDVSGSMTDKCTGSKTMSAYSVARAMALYFSELLEGRFAHTFLAFSNNVVIDSFEGDTPIDKYYNGYYKYSACNTNFFQIAELFGDLKKKGYPESEFPTGVVALSDGEFDRQSGDWKLPGQSRNYYNGPSRETVFEAFKEHLRKCGFSKEYVDNFKLVLWDVPNGYYGGSHSSPKFEALANTPNIFHMSGFDPAGIAFLTGTKQVESIPRTPEELFESAMRQELIQMLEI